VRARTTGLRTLTALLTVAFSGRERQGTFDMVMHYAAADKMRFTAFKDLAFSTRPIFDLVFVGDQYHVTMQDQGERHVYQGQVARFAQDMPALRVFLLVAEAFFLPGFDSFGNPPVFIDAATPQFTTRLNHGVTAHWFARPDNLEVIHARLDWVSPRGRISYFLEYSDYRQLEAYHIPGRVTLREPQDGFVTRTVVKQVDINLPLPAEAFDVSAAGPVHPYRQRQALCHAQPQPVWVKTS
jgi:hypothetical protein